MCVAKMRTLRLFSGGITTEDRIMNKYVMSGLGVVSMVNYVKGNGLLRRGELEVT